jgi:hypothetical protein
MAAAHIRDFTTSLAKENDHETRIQAALETIKALSALETPLRAAVSSNP